MSQTVYQIKISLIGIKPKIWRRILVPSNLLLSDFHKIIQTTMGWANCHLHQFVTKMATYSVKLPNDIFWDDSELVDYVKKKIRISDLLKVEKEVIKYEYDLGDDWIHEIKLEKILPADNKIEYPICVAGERNCPPEDCGGVWGYYHLLEIIKNPDHNEYEQTMEWLGEDYDPEYFDVDEVNYFLHTEDYGCIIY